MSFEPNDTEDTSILQDPLEEAWLLTPKDYWKETNITTITYLNSMYNLALFKDYFILAKPMDENGYDSKMGAIISPEEFAAGNIKGKIGLWLNAGNQMPEPIAFVSGSLLPKKNFLSSQIYQARKMGSIMVAPSYLRQINADINKYFKAKDALLTSKPNHPALQYAPKSKEDVKPEELLWLWYWYNAIHKRKARSYTTPKERFNVMHHIPLVAMQDIPLEKKVLFSDFKMTDYNLMKEYATLPIEWICTLHDKDTPFFQDNRMSWSFPEMPPRY